MKHSNSKTNQTHAIGNRLVQRVVVEESTQVKWVKLALEGLSSIAYYSNAHSQALTVKPGPSCSKHCLLVTDKLINCCSF